MWPALTTSGRPRAGRGVSQRALGTIRFGKRLQVTYHGRPLYRYSQRLGRGNTSYVGTSEFGGRWDAITTGGAARG